MLSIFVVTLAATEIFVSELSIIVVPVSSGEQLVKPTAANAAIASLPMPLVTNLSAAADKTAPVPASMAATAANDANDAPAIAKQA